MKKTAAESVRVLNRIAQSSKAYYSLLSDGPGREYFPLFLEGLPEGIRTYYQQKGFERSRKSLLFRRYVLEQEGRRMDAFLKEQLDGAAFKLWQEQDNFQMELFFRLKHSA